MQVARLQREERLGALQVELANRKRLRLSQLRGFSRVVSGMWQLDTGSLTLAASGTWQLDTGRGGGVHNDAASGSSVWQ